MASSVFYRFKSQKEPSRITFDGTGISVFELKRAIIETSNLGDGADFELTLTSSDGGEVYSDDTEIVPRSTIVIAKRQPATRPGRGGAARYVSGKPPASSRHNTKSESTSTKIDRQNELDASAAASAISELESEKQREEAVLKLGAEMWKNQQKEMATAAPVRTSYKSKAVSNPTNTPPDWYICNRCGIKGHWIKDCPQNGNPDFDDNRRIKKSIGIPRSRLEIIDKNTLLDSNGNVDSSKLPVGAMIDGDGNYVIVKPDKAAWNKFQEKANKSAAAQEEEARGSEELRNKGLECPIDKRLFVDPTKTSCCQAIYCNECITNALLDDDLRCPNCGTDGVLVDDLKPDDEVAARVHEYRREKENIESLELRSPRDANLSATSHASPGGVKMEPSQHHPSTSSARLPNAQPPQQAPSATSPRENLGRKRKAENEPVDDRKSPRLSASSLNSNSQKADRGEDVSKPFEKEPPRGPKALTEAANASGASMMSSAFGLPAGLPGVANPMLGMMPMMWDTTIMFNPFAAVNPMYGPPPNLHQGGMPNSAQVGMQGQGYQGKPRGSSGRGNHSNHRNGMNQPYRVFNASRPNPEESAYFRAPVNPHRHQNRRNMPRPTDYREI